MRYDEPGNQELLRSIQQGYVEFWYHNISVLILYSTAPVSFMNVSPGQRVNLNVATRLSEEYVPPKMGNFSGSGQRLGAPTPAAATPGAAHLMPGSFPSGSSSAAGSSASVERHSINTRFEVDQTQPTTSVQIRLADGTRMPCRMNLTHTVGDLRSFINAYVVFSPWNLSESLNIFS
jgi:UBX domain-containing protein 1